MSKVYLDRNGREGRDGKFVGRTAAYEIGGVDTGGVDSLVGVAEGECNFQR